MHRTIILSTFLTIIDAKENRKGVILSLIIITFPMVSGTIVFVNYSAKIFHEVSSNLSPIVSSMIVALIQLIGSYIATLLVEKTGRKILLIVSSIGSFLSLTVMGSYYYLKDIQVDISQFTYTPLLSFSVLVLFTAVGLSTVPFVVIAELVPERLRGPVFTVCVVLFSGLTTILMMVNECETLYNVKIKILFFQSFIPLVESIGMHGYIWLYAVLCIVACAITVLFIPETRSKKFG